MVPIPRLQVLVNFKIKFSFTNISFSKIYPQLLIILVHLVCKLYNQQAAAYFHMKITHIPINEDTRKVDINAMRRAINKNTCVVSWSYSGTSIVHHTDLLRAANVLCSSNMKAYLLILQLVGSAPQFPHGIIDDIQAISEVTNPESQIRIVDCTCTFIPVSFSDS